MSYLVPGANLGKKNREGTGERKDKLLKEGTNQTRINQ